MNDIPNADHRHVDRRRRVAAIALPVVLLALVGAWFAPSVVEGMSGGFALSVLMILIAVTAGARRKGLPLEIAHPISLLRRTYEWKISLIRIRRCAIIRPGIPGEERGAS